MKMKQALLLSAMFAPALLALAPRGDKLSFHPEKGSTAAKSFSVKQEFSLDEMSAKMNGNETPMPKMEMTMRMSTQLKVIDEYVELGDGRPAKLKRKYDSIAGDGNFKMDLGGAAPNQDKSMKLQSELEGKAVIFTWDKDANAFTKAFDQTEGDKALIENLQEDLDLRGFLPGKEVAEGDTWKLDASELRALIAPASDLHMKPDDPSAEKAMTQMGMGNMDFSKMFSDLGSDAITATYQGTRDDGGSKLAVIHLAVKASGSHDGTEDAKKMLDSMPKDAPKPEFDHVDIEIKIEGEGELLWDLRGGRARSLKLDGTIKLHQDLAMKINVGGGNMNMETSFAMSGPINADIEFTKG